MLELSAAARDGDSGGPIFNSHGELAGVLFGASRSQVFALSLALLAQFVQTEMTNKRYTSIEEVNEWIALIYL